MKENDKIRKEKGKSAKEEILIARLSKKLSFITQMRIRCLKL
jgi:hypothetical protein